MRRFNPAAAALGLGDTTLPSVPKPTTPTTLPTVPTTQTPTTPPKKSIWETIDNVLNAGQKGADIYDTVKNNSGSGPVYTSPAGGGSSNLPGTNIPQPDKGMSTGAKVALGVGGVALLGTGIYLATRKKKGLGCPDNSPAPTSSLDGTRRRKKRKK